MKQRYDFTKGKRGQFYQADAVFKLPVYLNPDIEAYLTKQAEANGVELSDLVNELLKKDIEGIEAGR